MTARLGSRGTGQAGQPGTHRWQRLRNPEGGWYHECRRCGTQRDDNGGGKRLVGEKVADPLPKGDVPPY
jgi:hypothetical protein